MAFLLIIVILLALTVVPVMIGARVVRADKAGFGTALFAVVLLAALSAAIEHFIANQVLAFLVAVAGGAAILAGVLGTTFLRGLAVSAIVVGVQLGVLLVFAGMAASAAAADGDGCDFDQAALRAQLRTDAARVPGARVSADGTEARWTTSAGHTVVVMRGGCVDLGASVTVRFAAPVDTRTAVHAVVEATTRWSGEQGRAAARVLASARVEDSATPDGRIAFDAPTDAEAAFPFGFALQVSPTEVVLTWQEL